MPKTPKSKQPTKPITPSKTVPAQTVPAIPNSHRLALLASIKETRRTLTEFPHLRDCQAFALQILADFAEQSLDATAQLPKLETLCSTFHVRITELNRIESLPADSK